MLAFSRLSIQRLTSPLLTRFTTRLFSDVSKNAVFIANISWQADDDIVKKHMQKAGPVTELNLFRRPDGRLVGAGVVTYADVESAANAIKVLHESELLERNIVVREHQPRSRDPADRPQRREFRERRASETAREPREPQPNCVFVSNINFNAQEDDLKAFMEQAGPVTNVRFFRGSDGKPLGQGMVTFADVQSATNAVNKINEVEFMERPLVVREDRGSQGDSRGNFRRNPRRRSFFRDGMEAGEVRRSQRQESHDY